MCHPTQHIFDLDFTYINVEVYEDAHIIINTVKPFFVINGSDTLWASYEYYISAMADQRQLFSLFYDFYQKKS